MHAIPRSHYSFLRCPLTNSTKTSSSSAGLLVYACGSCDQLPKRSGAHDETDTSHGCIRHLLPTDTVGPSSRPGSRNPSTQIGISAHLAPQKLVRPGILTMHILIPTNSLAPPSLPFLRAVRISRLVLTAFRAPLCRHPRFSSHLAPQSCPPSRRRRTGCALLRDTTSSPWARMVRCLPRLRS